MMTKSPSRDQICETELDAKGQMMTKYPTKRSNVWNRIGRKGSNDDQISFKGTNLWNRSVPKMLNDDEMSFKETNFEKQNWLQWVKWWPNVLQRDQIYEIELVAMGQMMTKCPSKRPNLWERGVRIGSNYDQMSFKETNFAKKNWSQWVKWWPNLLQRDKFVKQKCS